MLLKLLKSKIYKVCLIKNGKVCRMLQVVKNYHTFSYALGCYNYNWQSQLRDIFMFINSIQKKKRQEMLFLLSRRCFWLPGNNEKRVNILFLKNTRGFMANYIREGFKDVCGQHLKWLKLVFILNMKDNSSLVKEMRTLKRKAAIIGLVTDGRGMEDVDYPILGDANNFYSTYFFCRFFIKAYKFLFFKRFYTA